MADVILETITIKYDTVNDRFTYDPPYLPKIDTKPSRTKPASAGGPDQPQVCWECEVDGEPNNNFAIHFVGPVPTRRVRRRSTTGQIVENLVVGGHGGPPGRYHYFLAVSLESGEIFTDDPDIIVW